MNSKINQFSIENQELRARLAEAEDTLRAIRNGEIDALVVKGNEGDQVFTLEGADFLYRQLIEEMREGALIVNAEGIVLYANRRFAEFLKIPLEELIGSMVADWFETVSKEALADLLSIGEAGRAELQLASRDGSNLAIQLSVNRQVITGQPYFLCLVAIDLTEINARKQQEADLLKEQLRVANQFRRELLSVVEDQKIAQSLLAKNQKLTQDIIDGSPSLIYSLDLAGNFTLVNQSLLTLFNIQRDQLIGRGRERILPQAIARLHRNHDLQVVKNGTGVELEEENIQTDGTHVYLSQKFPLFAVDGKIEGICGISTDITARKQMENSLRERTQAVEQSPNAIYITDLEGNIEWVNSGFIKMSGYTLEEVKGHNPSLLQSGNTPGTTFVQMWAQLLKGEEWRGELYNRRKDGTEYIEATMISPVRDALGKIISYMAIQENITEQKRAEARIEQLAHFDQLTGLPNRSQLIERFKFALSMTQRDNKQLSVMFLDLDRFKEVNDTLGHSLGDLLLIEIARRLKAALRDEDIVARLGGDEFILILPATDEHGAAQVARKLLGEIAQPCLLDGHEVISTPSIGIAIYPHDGNDFDSLSKCADTAMYRVKQEGRHNYCFFTAEMQAHATRTSLLGNALRFALSRGEFVLHYQPQVLMNGRVAGAEALLRWQHPELGLISPAEFIPIAEDSGLIIPIGEWVLRTAVHQLKAWQAAGMPPFLMAVNLSAVQFRQVGLTELVTGILDEAQLPHQYLELELTEAVAMSNPEAAMAVMNRLYEQGIRMSIDDFGTGYSSLSYLKRFKVYKLKIDQSFVRDISEDTDDKAIVTAVINLAKSLGLKTIAEGVETAEQLAFLRHQGCDEIQGYYFSRPLPAGDFENYIKKNLIKDQSIHD